MLFLVGNFLLSPLCHSRGPTLTPYELQPECSGSLESCHLAVMKRLIPSIKAFRSTVSRSLPEVIFFDSQRQMYKTQYVGGNWHVLSRDKVAKQGPSRVWRQTSLVRQRAYEGQ